MSTRRFLIAATCALGALSFPTVAQAVTLHGTVGPEFNIALTNDAGTIVTHLDPGTYDIEVNDRSEFHNFHLTGPGVDVTTEVGTTGRVTWTVTFQEGVYNYVCDPHAETMHGVFTVGNAQLPVEPPPAPAAPPPNPTPAKNRLIATVGPGFTISLTLNGKRVRSVKAGAYTIVVRDRSALHNFHLIGPGMNRRTSVAGKPTTTWRVPLRKGIYRFVCDPHAAVMKGSFRVI
jgi:plastocyanin